MERTELCDSNDYVSWVFGDRFRIVMSSIMRWRRGEIGFVIGELLLTEVHKRAILEDRRLLTDDPTPIEVTTNQVGDSGNVTQALFQNQHSQLQPKTVATSALPRSGFVE